MFKIDQRSENNIQLKRSRGLNIRYAVDVSLQHDIQTKISRVAWWYWIRYIDVKIIHRCFINWNFYRIFWMWSSILFNLFLNLDFSASLTCILRVYKSKKSETCWFGLLHQGICGIIEWKPHETEITTSWTSRGFTWRS